MKDNQKIPFKIIDDGMICILDVSQLNDDVSKDEILSAINQQGVIFGINQDVMDKIADAESFGSDKIVIARGEIPVHGQDARIILCYRPPDPSHVKHEDKHVMFRQSVKLAKKDEVLLVKLKATDGVSGKTVTGDIVPSKAGKDIEFMAGKNILKRYYEDKVEYSAFREGIVRLKPAGIHIESLHLVDHDINLNSGNLNLESSAYINGSILPGFKVSSGGAVTLSGRADKAEIAAKKEIEVYQVVTGGSHLVAGGSVQVMLVEHSTIQATGDILVEKESVFSKLTAGGSIVVGKGKGSVSGGILRAGKIIEAGSVGTPLGAQPELIIGMDVSISDLESNLKKKDARLIHLQKMQKQMRFDGVNQHDWAIRHLQKRLDTLNAERSDLAAAIQNVNNSKSSGKSELKIVIRHFVRKGVKIKFGSMEYIVMEDSDGGTFHIDETGNKIVFSKDKTEIQGARS